MPKLSELSDGIQRAWDSGAAHLARHSRKYQFLGLVVVSLPQSAPATYDAAAWLYTSMPASVSPWWTVIDFSWYWITTPVGLGFMALVWWETRKLASRGNHPHSSEAELPYPTVRIYRHEEARKHGDAVFQRIHDRFADAGWRVEGANTDLPQHRTGIRIAGKAGFDKEAAKWGLETLGIEWIPDERTNPPDVLELLLAAMTTLLTISRTRSRRSRTSGTG